MSSSKIRYGSILFLTVLLTTTWVCGQNTFIQGLIMQENGEALPDVAISINNTETGVTSDKNGFYKLELPSAIFVEVIFSHLSHKPVLLNIKLEKGELYEFNPVLSKAIEQIGEVIITSDGRRQVEGINALSPKMIRLIPGANAGIENVLKTLPGVNSNNELSTQYMVRGGNYDENLVYVNEIEVYRPFLIRSGQQEGLSFVNPDLTQNVDFSAGGFQSKYGDKMASVLDITYRTPVSFGMGAEISFLGASMFVEGASADKKMSAIGGVRYRNNQLFVESQQTETNFKPRFIDAQMYAAYSISPKFYLHFFGALSENNYEYEPLTRRTNFGTISNPIAVLVEYDGKEDDEYHTYFGAIKASYFPKDNLNLKFISSVYQTTEQEFFDIQAQYSLGEVNTDLGDENFGELAYPRSVGNQLTHARNFLDALIFDFQHKGNYRMGTNTWEWGLGYRIENFRDRVVEWEILNYEGFFIRPPEPEYEKDEPYEPYTAPLLPYGTIRAKNNVINNRIMAYSQWSRSERWGKNTIWYNVGVRVQWWNVLVSDKTSSAQYILAPRAQWAIKPDWARDMVFRLAGGAYHQPPFYREMRNQNGEVIPEVKAQKSYHLVAGLDYSFKWWKRPFKLTSELYYKGLGNVNPFTLENVRIRYQAANNAKAYAYGFDMQLTGEFVPGTQSWLSFGYLRTEENIDNRGYISRPTDQRLKFALLFQDYMPLIPSLRLYMNLVYNTGLPGGSPSYADPYSYQSRLPDYRRVDLGISYVFTDANHRFPQGHWLHPFLDFYVGLEIFNIFDNLNSITNIWVRDVSTQQQFAIPNYLTQRVFSLKAGIRL